MWKMSFPPEVVVSIASVMDLKPIWRLLRAVIVLEGPAEPVQAPDNEGVSCSQVAEGFLEACALGLGAGGGVGEDAIASCLLEGVLLKSKGLVCG
jgi:hypothetical protein